MLFARDECKTPYKRPMPIVKLKVGDSSPSATKPQVSVADLNNVRNNYRNYCHYRVEKDIPPFPSLQRYSSTKASKASGNSVILILRGGAQNTAGMGKGSSQGRNAQAGSPMSLVPFVKAKGQVRTVSIPSQVRPSAEDAGVLELRGSPMLRADSGLRDEKGSTKTPSLCAPVSTLMKRTGVTIPPMALNAKRGPGDTFLQIGAFPSHIKHRIKSGATHKRNVTPEINDASIRDDLLPQLLQRELRMSRRVRFNEDPDIARFTGYMLAEDSVRIGKIAAPLQLTTKNLEIFDYLSAPVHEYPYENAPYRLDPRIMEWVQHVQPEVADCSPYQQQLQDQIIEEGEIGLIEEEEGTEALEEPSPIAAPDAFDAPPGPGLGPGGPGQGHELNPNDIAPIMTSTPAPPVKVPNAYPIADTPDLPDTPRDDTGNTYNESDHWLPSVDPNLLIQVWLCDPPWTLAR